MSESLTLKERRDIGISKFISEHASVIKSWFLNTGYKFMENRKYTLDEEGLIEELTDYYLDNLVQAEKK